MRKLAPDTWIAIGLLAILVIITAVVSVREAKGSAIPYASFSNAADGTLALKLWLEALNYTTVDSISPGFEPPEDATLIFMLEPNFPVTEEEWQIIDQWIDKGGTLVVAGNLWNTQTTFQHFSCQLAFLDQAFSQGFVQIPLFTSPPLDGAVKVETLNYLEVWRAEYTILLEAEEKPIVITFNLGKGRVILSSAPFPFSNAGLKESSNPSFVLNIVGLAGQQGKIWFDEWHHGLRAPDEQILGPANWLRRTSAGQALLFVGSVIFGALLLRGRHFGQPIKPSPQDNRRTPLEHVTSIANLNRRARHRHAVLEHYRHQLKRSLGKRYHINPSQADSDFVAELFRINPQLDTQELNWLLTQLQNEEVSESQMLELAIAVTGWLTEIPKR